MILKNAVLFTPDFPLVTNKLTLDRFKLTLDRFCEDWRIKLMCTSGPCPRSALEESSNGIGGHRPYRGHGPLVHNPCPGQWFYPSLFGSGSSGLGYRIPLIDLCFSPGDCSKNIEADGPKLKTIIFSLLSVVHARVMPALGTGEFLGGY